MKVHAESSLRFLNLSVQRWLGSDSRIFWLAFSDEVHIRRSDQIDPASMAYFSTLHAALLERGVYLGPSGYEVGFVSAAHTDEDLDRASHAFIEALDVAFS